MSRMKQFTKKTIKKCLYSLGYEIERLDSVPQTNVAQKIVSTVTKTQTTNSPQQNDTFTNDFQFNMFVESNLDMEVKRNIIAQLFYKNIGYYPNINNPKTFSEKVLWLKLYYDDPLIAKCCDKVGVKEYIDEKLGTGYTVPIIKQYENVFDINLDELPDKFALKVNWATGCNIIVTDKNKINIDKVRATLDRWTLPWKTSYYGSFNRGYKDVKAKIFAEEYLDIPKNSTEYKAFCFNGKVRFTLVEMDYFGKSPKRGYYDRNGDELPIKLGKIEKGQWPEIPKEYEEIIRIAEILAEPFPYVRVDFYSINEKLYVGELTFYSGGGFTKISPSEWDHIFGEELDISKEISEYNKKMS